MTQSPKPRELREIIGEKIGEASMCWSETPKGIFESTRALKIWQDILDAVEVERESLKEKLELAVGALEKITAGKNRSGVPNSEAGIAKETLEKIKE